MEPLERSVSHGTDTESVDTINTNQSMGPALVGNISVDSLDEHSPISLIQPAQQQQQPVDTESEKRPIEEKLKDDEPESGSRVQESDSNSKFEESKDESQLSVQEEEPQQQQQEQQIGEIYQVELEDSSQVKLEGPKQEPTQETDKDDSEREQQHQQTQDRTSTQDLSAHMSVSNTSEVQVQGSAHEKEEEPAYHPRGEVEVSSKDKKGEVEAGEQKVDFTEEDLKQELLEPQKYDEDQEQQRQEENLTDTSISLIKLHDTSNNELFHHTFKTAANVSQDSKQFGDELEEDKNSIMEFAKNYSDDLISNELHRATSGENNNDSGAGGHDLADFELPPYSGSTTSDQTATKHSPAKQRKSSNSMASQASSSYQASGSNASAVAHDLSAVKNVLKSTYSRFSHVFQWERPIESGIIFGIGLTFIIALTFFSIISVTAYSALGIICASGLLRIYKTGMKALNRSPDTPVDHLWYKALSLSVSLSPERLHDLVDTSHANLNASMVYFKQVLLVEDKFATFKFFLFLYSLTYIGAWFNGLTLITLIYIALFSVPLFYEKNKTKIDEYMNLVTKQVCSSISMVTDRFGSILGSQSCGGGSKKQN